MRITYRRNARTIPICSLVTLGQIDVFTLPVFRSRKPKPKRKKR